MIFNIWKRVAHISKLLYSHEKKKEKKKSIHHSLKNERKE